MRRVTKYDKFDHFSANEHFGVWTEMAYSVVFFLDKLRSFIGKKIIVHRGYDPMAWPGSTHRKGLAVDCHAEGISLFDFYMAASRFPFKGIGIYPNDWKHPGLHLDVREKEIRSLWGRVNGIYVNLDLDFFKTYLLT